MWNIKALALTVQKLLSRLMLLKNRSNTKVKVRKSKLFIPTKRCCLRKYSCQISKLTLNTVDCTCMYQLVSNVTNFNLFDKKYSFAVVINKSHHYFLHVLFQDLAKDSRHFKSEWRIHDLQSSPPGLPLYIYICLFPYRLG